MGTIITPILKEKTKDHRTHSQRTGNIIVISQRRKKPDIIPIAQGTPLTGIRETNPQNLLTGIRETNPQNLRTLDFPCKISLF